MCRSCRRRWALAYQKTKYSAKRDGDRADFDTACNLRKQKNSEKFKKLYDEGDFSDYSSQSEADAALCAIIAFRIGPDPDAIDSVFRDSTLYRDKWERDDYREARINIGIEACHGIFHRSRMEHPYFIKFDEKGAPYVFPEEYSVSRSFITAMANLAHRFLHLPQYKKNRHSR